MEKTEPTIEETKQTEIEMETSESANHNLCRLCLDDTMETQSLFEANLMQMLRDLTGIKIFSIDYSETCKKCIADLKYAYNVQQGFISCNNKFLATMSDGIERTKKVIKKKKKASVREKPANSDIIPIDDLDKIKIEKEEYNEHVTEVVTLLEYENNSDLNEDKIENAKCYICGFVALNNDKLLDHINEHNNIVPKCEKCDKEFENITAYVEHLQNEPEHFQSVTDWSCEQCNLSFDLKELFNVHMSFCHAGKDEINILECITIKKEPTRKAPRIDIHPKQVTIKRERNRKRKSTRPPYEPTPCDCCGKVFKTKRALQSHVQGSKRRQCPTCNAEVTNWNMSKHIAMAHSNAIPMVCHLCGATTKNAESLRGHMYYTHSQRQYTCEHCGRIFKKKYSYGLHVNKEHIGDKKFVCDTCGKKFFTKHTLTTHNKMTHLKLRNHVCIYCKKAFSSRFAMRTHERQHTNENPFVCDICGEAFRQKVSLKSHKKSKHNIVEKATMECKDCGKMFASDAAIKSHMRLHL